MRRRSEYRAAAGVILLQVLLLGVGSQILASVFDFPEVLRVPAAERLALFRAHQGLIIPAYYAMALTGLTQLTIAVLLFQAFDERGDTLLLLGAVFGVLSGAWQAMGFLRWAILIPYLAEAMAQAGPGGPAAATVALAEGVANRYIGMAVGEHLGFIGQTVWTVLLSAAMLRRRLFERRLAWLGLGLGVLTVPVCLETLGGPFTAFASLPMPIVTAWVVWLLLLGVSLVRTDPATAEGPRLGWPTWTAAAALYLAFVLPALGD